VRALVDEINGHAAPHSEYLFRPELVLRGSTAVARATGAASAGTTPPPRPAAPLAVPA
jgi:LacI family transcriptional regulator, repressor for deo operon, udp, cdd, tsx, nupC, and nupG